MTMKYIIIAALQVCGSCCSGELSRAGRPVVYETAELHPRLG